MSESQNPALNRFTDPGVFSVVRKVSTGAILHGPHASILLSDAKLKREIIRMTDSFTEDLFQVDSSLSTPVAEYCQPHHQHLTDAVQTTLDRRGSCFIIDCHSFSSVPQPNEQDQSPDRPEMGLGSDSFHTPKKLRKCALGLLTRLGFDTLLNRPFSGVLVPMEFYQRDRRVWAIRLEVNRRLYLDEATGQRLPSFSAFKVRFNSVLNGLIRMVS